MENFITFLKEGEWLDDSEWDKYIQNKPESEWDSESREEPDYLPKYPQLKKKNRFEILFKEPLYDIDEVDDDGNHYADFENMVINTITELLPVKKNSKPIEIDVRDPGTMWITAPYELDDVKQILLSNKKIGHLIENITIAFGGFIGESVKRLGKLKIPVDPMNSHRFKERGTNRKNLRQVPDIYRPHKTSMMPIDSLASMVKGLDTSSRTVDIAKKAPSGVWRLSKKEVFDIARKYKFIIPNENKPMKHLGSTGIQIVRFKPGMYYLYKPRRSGPRHYKKRSPFGRGHAKIIKGISAS